MASDPLRAAVFLAHLLCHAAGFTHEAPAGGNFDVGPESFEDHVRSISDTWLRFPVGARHEYSNLGVDLAAHIVARARDTDFPACMRDSVLNPLGMTRSTYELAALEATASRAIGHDPDVPELPVKVPMLGAGDMYSCIADLAKFLKAELAGQVLQPQLAAQMRTVQFPVPGQVTGYGLGLGVWAGDDWTVYGGSGGGFGFLADLFWEPATGSGVAVLTNSSGHPLVSMFAIQILARLAGRDPDRPAGSPAAGGRPATAEEYSRFRGQYAGRGSVFELVTRDGLIGLTTGANSFIALTALENGDLLAHVPGVPMPLQLRPTATPDGRPSHLLTLLDGSALGYNSASDRPSIQAAARAQSDAPTHAGSYEIRTLGPESITATLELDAGRLWLKAPDLTGTPRLRLDPDQTMSGLYFDPNGEVLDLRTDPPTYASLPLHRQS